MRKDSQRTSNTRPFTAAGLLTPPAGSVNILYYESIALRPDLFIAGKISGPNQIHGDATGNLRQL